VLRQNGIFPVPMLMHHDRQPLISWRGNQGLLNQLRMLRKAGAVNMQVLMLTPAVGSKWYDRSYTSGLAFKSVSGVPVETALRTGTHVVASNHPHPWTRQLSLLAGYVYFFNPLRLLGALVFPLSRIPKTDTPVWPPPSVVQGWPRLKRFKFRLKRQFFVHMIDAGLQLFGIWALFPTMRRTLGWTFKLMVGKIERHNEVPASRIPMRGVKGKNASHALPSTPTCPETMPLNDVV
jgi:hypothetical protein